MEQAMRKENVINLEQVPAAIGAAQLLHPAEHFDHPLDVLAINDISVDEKRGILASWASDCFVIESTPALRLYPGTDKPVTYDEIIQALKMLDTDRSQSQDQCAFESFKNHTTRRRPQALRFGGRGLCSYWKGGRRPHRFET
jgi:hypothetical protein